VNPADGQPETNKAASERPLFPDNSDTGLAIVGTVRDAWLRILAHSVLCGLNQTEKRNWWRIDRVCASALICVAVGYIVNRWCYPFVPQIVGLLPDSFLFWPIIGFLSVGTVFCLANGLMRWLSPRSYTPMCPSQLIDYLHQAGVSGSCKPVPLLMKFATWFLGIFGVIDRLEYKGLRFYTRADIDPNVVFDCVDKYLKRTDTHLLLLIDNLEHVVDLEQKNLRLLLIQQFFSVFRGFRERYKRIRLKVFVRTDVAALSHYADRTQLATRHVHLVWTDHDGVWRLLAKRFLVNDPPRPKGLWALIEYLVRSTREWWHGQPDSVHLWRKSLRVKEWVEGKKKEGEEEQKTLEKAAKNLFGVVFPEHILMGEWNQKERRDADDNKIDRPENLKLADTAEKGLDEVLQEYFSDGMGSVQPRFVLHWAKSAIHAELEFREKGKRAVDEDGGPRYRARIVSTRISKPPCRLPTTRPAPYSGCVTLVPHIPKCDTRDFAIPDSTAPQSLSCQLQERALAFA